MVCSAAGRLYKLCRPVEAMALACKCSCACPCSCLCVTLSILRTESLCLAWLHFGRSCKLQPVSMCLWAYAWHTHTHEIDMARVCMLRVSVDEHEHNECVKYMTSRRILIHLMNGWNALLRKESCRKTRQTWCTHTHTRVEWRAHIRQKRQHRQSLPNAV